MHVMHSSTATALPAFEAGPGLGRIDRTHIGRTELDLLDKVIDRLEDTTEDTWWPGPTYRSPCGTRHCALSHIETTWGMEAMGTFESTWSNSYVIGAVNDGKNPRYPQPTPKARSLAYLHALRRGDEPDINTGMEHDSRASLAHDAARQPLDLAAAQAHADRLGHPVVVSHLPVAVAVMYWSTGEPGRALAATREADINDADAFDILYAALRGGRKDGP